MMAPKLLDDFDLQEELADILEDENSNELDSLEEDEVMSDRSKNIL